MSERLGYILLAATLLFGSCKKQQEKEEVIPVPAAMEYHPDGSVKFLKELKVSDAEKIVIDSISKNVTIYLPTDFSADVITLNLTMYGGISLLDSSESITASKDIKFAYKGSKPLRFQLRASDGKEMSYDVYVNAAGNPKVQLSANEIALSFGSFVLPLRIMSGIGTTPSAPGQSLPTARLSDPKSGWVSQGSYQDKQVHAYIQHAGKLMSGGGLRLEIKFDNDKTVIFDNLKFKRGLPNANLLGYDNILIPNSDSIMIHGGYFSPAEKYTVQYSSDFLSQPVSVNLKFTDSANVHGALPINIVSGSYLTTFYEGAKVIGKSSVYISDDKTHSIETIWKGNVQMALLRNTEKLTFRKGEMFYAKPWPPKFSMGSATFHEKDLPHLRMKSGSTMLDLKPQLDVVSWPIAGLTYSVGKYTIPLNISSDSYEASLVFPDKRESKPYWSKITVR